MRIVEIRINPAGFRQDTCRKWSSGLFKEPTAYAICVWAQWRHQNQVHIRGKRFSRTVPAGFWDSYVA